MARSSDLPLLPARDPRGHKGTFGTVAVLGGCCAGTTLMIGAPALAALGALRAGAGLVRVYAPAPILPWMLTIVPEATGYALPVDSSGAVTPAGVKRGVAHAAGDAQCLVIGPGMGAGPGAVSAVGACLRQRECPVVIDADALSVLGDAGVRAALRRGPRAPAILTPHPGEFRRVLDALGVRPPRAPLEGAGAEKLAHEAARRLGCVLVLKGHRTIITDGRRTRVNTTGNDALATGGTGDVLAGLIGGLLAQSGPRPGRREALGHFDLAAIGVRAHGLGAERWRARTRASAGLSPLDLAEGLPAVLEAMRARRRA